MAYSGASAEFRIAAFRAEAEALAATVRTLDDTDLARPSPCPPWTTGALLCHVITAAGRIDQAVVAGEEGPTARDAVRPQGPLVDARGYYSPDERFSPAVNADRIDPAAEFAARLGTASAMRAELAEATGRTLTVLRTEPPDLEVRTRHGDRMLLTEFLVTRVVELGVHGLDLASGLGLQPWLTVPAAEVIEDLLLPEARSREELHARLGCDRTGVISRLTGRVPFSPGAREVLAGLGVTWLTLG
jgi:uncharacterized protein (TIGR03083 family)